MYALFHPGAVRSSLAVTAIPSPLVVLVSFPDTPEPGSLVKTTPVGHALRGKEVGVNSRFQGQFAPFTGPGLNSL